MRDEMLTRFIRKVFGDRHTNLLFRLVAESGWEHRWRYLLAVAFMVTVAAMGGAVALIMEDVMQDVFIERRSEMVKVIAFWVLGVFVIRGVATYGQQVVLARIGNLIVARLRERIYAHILAQGMAFFAAQTAGDLTTRISMNANQAREALNLLAVRLGADLFALLAFLGVMLWQDVALTAIALIGLPLVLGGVSWLVARVRGLARAQVTLTGQILGTMGETVLGARVIKAFNLEDKMRTRMSAAVHGVRDRADRIAMFQAMVNPLMETMAGLAGGTVILYGGWRVIEGTMDVGTFFSFVTALFMAADPARRLGQLNVALRQQMAGVEAIYDLLDGDAVMPERPTAARLVIGRADVRFEDVHFAYEGSGEGGAALAGLSFLAPAGQVTALVGPSGAGKSTVLSLIERFFDPDTGRITIDGKDIRDATLESLREQIALVTQETFLFDATIAENIAFGRPGASRAEIEAAAEQANATEFVSRMPEGLDTRVGEGGARLSGGQRQRIAIARAMLRDAPILLLDEATSALDAETEERVTQALARLMRDRTTIVIAHRLATVRSADHICVLEAGRLKEEGAHDALVAKHGLYARLAALQFGPEKEPMT